MKEVASIIENFDYLQLVLQKPMETKLAFVAQSVGTRRSRAQPVGWMNQVKHDLESVEVGCRSTYRQLRKNNFIKTVTPPSRKKIQAQAGEEREIIKKYTRSL